MRILCIADEYPWPATNGLRIRLANVLTALAEAGDVDFFCTVSERPDLHDDLPDVRTVRRCRIHHREPYRSSVRGLPRWLLRSRLPRSVEWRDWHEARNELRAWATGDYDVVWYCHGHPWLGLRNVVTGPAIVDLLDLESEKLRTLARIDDLDLGPDSTTGLRRFAGRVLARVDADRWERAYREIKAHASRVVVCSDLDRERLGAPDAAVIPNGFEAAPTVHDNHREPVMTMVGLQIYEPNIDGAHFFAKHVLPLVRTRVPDARFVIAGRHTGALDDLVGLDGVDVRGEVHDLGTLFASTAVVTVPLRAGSGTRVKVLEAFARGLPVAGTTIGCEGLGIVDGRHALLGDTPEALADACVRLLTDTSLATSVAKAGHGLWQAEFQWKNIRDQIRALAVEVGG